MRGHHPTSETLMEKLAFPNGHFIYANSRWDPYMNSIPQDFASIPQDFIAHATGVKGNST